MVYHNLVHHLADIGQTSPPLRIFVNAITPACFFFCCDLFHNQRLAVLDEILLNIVFCISKTVTDEVVYLRSDRAEWLCMNDSRICLIIRLRAGNIPGFEQSLTHLFCCNRSRIISDHSPLFRMTGIGLHYSLQPFQGLHHFWLSTRSCHTLDNQFYSFNFILICHIVIPLLTLICPNYN